MPSTTPLVLLTGPNGFVGAHVLRQLLTSNYRVRGTVRSAAKSHWIAAQYPSETASGDLTFAIVPDIQAPHALDAALLGDPSNPDPSAAEPVTYACHVASPYFTSTSDPIAELVSPAVNGTKNVLASALQSSTLKRLTILSSFASVVDLAKNPRPGYTYTSADWDPITPAQAAQDGYMGYHASKTFAERAAWDAWADARPRPAWDLVTFCPPMIYGPPIQEVDASKGVEGLGTSLKRLLTSITGRDPLYPGKVASFGLPAFCDVRDVARAHVSALSLAQGTSERFLLCGGMAMFEDGLVGLREEGEEGIAAGKGETIKKEEWYGIDRSKAERMLGIRFVEFPRTVEDTWEKVKDLGLLR